MTDEKSSNPKEAMAADKVALSLFPSSALAYGALGLMEGAIKYGAFNYRVQGARWSTYYTALLSHASKLNDGEWADPKTNVPHLAYMMANVAILIDAYESGVLTDDRPPSCGKTPKLLTEDFVVTVKRLKNLFVESRPRHYTITDTLGGIAGTKGPVLAVGEEFETLPLPSIGFYAAQESPQSPRTHKASKKRKDKRK